LQARALSLCVYARVVEAQQIDFNVENKVRTIVADMLLNFSDKLDS